MSGGVVGAAGQQRATTSSSTLKDGLLAYWAFDESSGDPQDSHTTNRDLTNTGPVTFATAKLNNGADFDGTSGLYFDAADSDVWTTATSGLTFAFWWYLDSSSGGLFPVLLDKDDTISYQLWYHRANAQLHWTVFDGGTDVTATWSSTLSEDTWYFIEVYIDEAGNFISINLNNGTAVTTAYNGTVANGSETLRIGQGHANDAAFAHDAFYDEFGAWSRLLTPTERSTLYGAGTPPGYPSF